MRRQIALAALIPLASCASAPRNPVLDKYPAGVQGRTSVTYYDVHGSTYAELRADMRRSGPKIDGGSFVGETRSPMRWSWRSESIGGGSCAMRDVRVSVNAQILLPRWTPPANVDSSLVSEWKRFIAALETHEAGHKDISARAGHDLENQLRGMTGLCSQLGTRASDIARRILDKADADQKRYDAETRHGITQGTGFRPPSVIAAASADSAAAQIRRLLVTPAGLELSVGDSVFSLDLYRRLDLRGITAQGDTLRSFAKTFILEPNTLLVRRGSDLVARGAGEAYLWILLGSRPEFDLNESERTVRVPIHIR